MKAKQKEKKNRYDIGLLRISIGIYWYLDFVANEYKQIAIHSLLTIHNIWSGIC